MYSNNKYWNMGYVQLEELEVENLMLYKDAKSRGDFQSMNKYERELNLIRDAMAAYERGNN